MKNIYYILLISLIFIPTNAQILDVPEVIQEENQWCWAGVSKAVLDYYTADVSQCEIAEYVREVSTWHNFGDVNCCENPNVGCNYWNYNWGTAGSIQDILIHFKEINNYGVSWALSEEDLQTEITATRPFIARWGWTSGGGHFVVGYGVSDEYIYYMNPWFGEGHHMSTYDWLVDDGNHTWTHTNIITTTLTTESVQKPNINFFPNPTNSILRLETDQIIDQVIIYDSLGKQVGIYYTDTINVSFLRNGIYTIEITVENNVYKELFIKN